MKKPNSPNSPNFSFKKPPRPSGSFPDDIPEAVREGAAIKRPRNSQQMLILMGVGSFLVLTFLSSLLFAFLAQRSSTSTPFQSRTSSALTQSAEVAPSSPESSNSVPAPQITSPAGTLLGHYPYQEAPANELEPITADGSIRLRRSAAQKFQEMMATAQADGVILIPLSGFRNLADQQYLFFEVKAQRRQNAQTRAEVSAPPGYSEHHTGYAVDIGDGNAPSADVNPNFEKTAAFKWLMDNAAAYNFELSFPKNNPQGIAYEPWHWRFVGDQTSLETFYKSRSTRP
ncbi:MAG: D-alanyl-D-alanine carboxypeptidase family protein [Leptolyngbyaceae cyanobacterium bins.59]|nr:D-alanyl-D-alanine carboxypeptidase family protein [Leptolyngbyaceae cyanobacterium bins.59]